MTITLGGAGDGPQSGGLTAIGGRPVQTTEPAPVREAVRPPAAAVPEMVVPKGEREAGESRTSRSPPEPRQSAPIRARQDANARRGGAPGNAVADTGARGQGFGLSTGGGAGSGSTLDVADFCCPDYLVLMVDKIRATGASRSRCRVRSWSSSRFNATAA